MNQRLSTFATWLLKRASRSAAQAAYRNAASQPSLPAVRPSSFIDASDQWYITSAGAMPKLIRSASESYCTPNSLWVLVRRATRPSMPSSTPAMKIARHAASKRPCDAAMIAKNPPNRPAVVNRLGSR